MVGWLHGFIAVRIASPPFAEIGGLVVDKTRRGTGIGKALVHVFETWAAERGISSIRVRSNIVRLEAHGFYEKLGYQLGKTQHVFVHDCVFTK